MVVSVASIYVMQTRLLSPVSTPTYSFWNDGYSSGGAGTTYRHDGRNFFNDPNPNVLFHVVQQSPPASSQQQQQQPQQVNDITTNQGGSDTTFDKGVAVTTSHTNPTTTTTTNYSPHYKLTPYIGIGSYGLSSYMPKIIQQQDSSLAVQEHSSATTTVDDLLNQFIPVWNREETTIKTTTPVLWHLPMSGVEVVKDILISCHRFVTTLDRHVVGEFFRDGGNVVVVDAKGRGEKGGELGGMQFSNQQEHPPPPPHK
eukprot:15365043-Ditylum_brightwellii.AAC.1